MSLTPEPPESPDIVGPPGTRPGDWEDVRDGPTRTITIDLARFPSAATAIGVGLLLAAAAISAAFARRKGELDGSVLTVGVLAILALLAVSAFAGLRHPDLERRASLASWPAAAAFAAGGVLLGVVVNDDKTSLYLGSATVFVLSLACYLIGRARAFVVTGLLALGLLYAVAFADLFLDDGDNALMIAGAGILAFVVVVTALGWLVPKDRAFIGVLTGAVTLYAMWGTFPLVGLFGFFALSSEGPGPGGEFHNPFENDIYVLLGICAVLVALWAYCAAATGHVGFRVLIIALTAMAPMAAVFGLGARHPTWWAVGLCALGGLALLVAVLRAPVGRDLVSPEAAPGSAPEPMT